MKTIDTLIDDIYALLGSGHEVSKEDVSKLSDAISVHIVRALSKDKDDARKLRASQLGQPDCKSWYNVHNKDNKEPLQPFVRLKFLFGHIHEELVLWLAEQAGHDVSHRQDTVEFNEVEGHPDGIIDGCLVDVKSANSRGMDKFRKNGLESDDPFGYLSQLDFYRMAMHDIEDLKDKDKVYFLVADKELGHLVLDKYDRSHVKFQDMMKKTSDKKDLVEKVEFPGRDFMPVPDGKSGNMMLDTQCRYCEHKYECWPGVRKFIYSNGPRWLTNVAKQPDVPEDKSR